MEYVFLFYIFLSFVVATGGVYVLFSNGHPLAAFLYLIGIIVLEAYFGQRWFTPAGKKQTASGPWPPALNTCPDFLSLTYLTNGEPVCVDTIGVSTNGMAKWTGPTQTDEKYLFHLFVTTSDAARAQSLCDQAKLKGVTWEGVYDGMSCHGGVPPLPATK
jgi:hypothetical protein